MILCFMAIVSAGSSEFSDPSSGVRLADYWRVATIRFPYEEENKCPRRNCRVHDRVEGDKSRAVRKVSNISAVGGAVVVKDKIPQRLIALTTAETVNLVSTPMTCSPTKPGRSMCSLVSLVALGVARTTKSDFSSSS
jgi:hypothetical protein